MNTYTEKQGVIQINAERIQEKIMQLASFGANKRGGIDRAFGSLADREARQFLAAVWENNLGLPVKTDAIANMWATHPGEENLPPIVLGSHHDTVSNGGAYDGAMGVLLATEVLETIIEHKIKLRHPLGLVSFSGEEPNPYGVSTLGSKTISGKLTKNLLLKVVNKLDKSSLKSAVAGFGGNLDKIDEICLTGGEMSAFLECHIEQGRRLYDKELSLGIVTAITGIYREKIKIVGQANHAGTTIMPDRQDALLAASQFNLLFEACIKNYRRSDVVGTIGALDVYPNSANIIPGEVELTVEFRTADAALGKEIAASLEEIAERVAKERRVRVEREVILDQAPVAMDEKIIKALRRSVDNIQEPTLDLVSMAGHDAAHMADFTKTGMLFVQSIDGKSHCPEEKSELADIVKAGNALLQAVFILDKELN